MIFCDPPPVIEALLFRSFREVLPCRVIRCRSFRSGPACRRLSYLALVQRSSLGLGDSLSFLVTYTGSWRVKDYPARLIVCHPEDAAGDRGFAVPFIPWSASVPGDPLSVIPIRASMPPAFIFSPGSTIESWPGWFPVFPGYMHRIVKGEGFR